MKLRPPELPKMMYFLDFHTVGKSSAPLIFFSPPEFLGKQVMTIADLRFFEKNLPKFSKCRARMTYSRAKNKKVVKYHFYRENFANWTILDHFQKNFRIKIFLDHPLNF